MKIKTLYFAAAIAALAASTAIPQEGASLILTGPIESVDEAMGTVTVLGQRISVRDSSKVLPGTVVNIYGKLESNGRLAATAMQNLSRFATGADVLYVKGIVTATSFLTGHLRVGGTDVDYTSLLASQDFRVPSLGEVVEFSGTQPNSRGVFLASLPVSGASSVIGTGHSSSVIGTGHSSSVIGTGHSSSVIGTGQASSVIGTGQASSVIGTGHSSSVIGTGQASSVIGTGQASSVIGTGHSSSVIGTGQASSVIGTGQSL